MLITFQCTNCGADVKVDDSKKITFCEACGTKLTVPVKKAPEPVAAEVAVPDAGSPAKIEQDMPKTVAEAVAVYDKGDYETALKALSAIAAADGGNWAAKLYAGLASSALSKPMDLRIRDGVTAVKNATAAGYDASDKFTIITEFSRRVRSFVSTFYGAHYVHPKDYVYDGANEAKDHFDGMARLVEYLDAICDVLTQETLTRWPELEATKKDIIKETLALVEAAGKPIVYLVGYKNTSDSRGQTVTKRVEQKMSSPLDPRLKAISEKLKNAYNTVPSTVSRIKKFDEEIDANRQVIQDYKSSLDEYLAQNPEDAKVYRRWRIFTSKKTIDDIESRFPESLLDKKAAAARSENVVSRLLVEKKKFIKENSI